MNFGLHTCNTIILNRYGSSKLLCTLILYYSILILSTLVPLKSFPWWWWWCRGRSDQWPARVAWQPAGSPKHQQFFELNIIKGVGGPVLSLTNYLVTIFNCAYPLLYKLRVDTLVYHLFNIIYMNTYQRTLYIKEPSYLYIYLHKWYFIFIPCTIPSNNILKHGQIESIDFNTYVCNVLHRSFVQINIQNQGRQTMSLCKSSSIVW